MAVIDGHFSFRGPVRIRTGVAAFAELSLAARPQDHSSKEGANIIGFRNFTISATKFHRPPSVFSCLTYNHNTLLIILESSRYAFVRKVYFRSARNH
jgi:hypothetical protein